ncbi:MAG: serine/threonine-protein kinase [Myxococcota bacterium]
MTTDHDADTLAADPLGGAATLPSGGVRSSGATPAARPRRIGRFAVLRLLGEGGMGRVWAAYDETLDRKVAIKVVKGDVSESARQRLRREAQAMARIGHENVVPVYEVGEDDGLQFIAMELVAGVTLAEWQDKHRGAWRAIVELYTQAAEGLAAAHAQGLVHRDFKPHNVMVDELNGQIRARVQDFGLVRVEGDVETNDRGSTAGGELTTGGSLTKAGSILGSPAYMAPEQFNDNAVSAAADQFAFCVSLFEGLCGARPFAKATSIKERLALIATTPPVWPKSSGAPARLRAIVNQGLHPDAGARHASMAVLAQALRGESAGRRRTTTTVAALAVGGLAVGVVSASLSTGAGLDPCDAEVALQGAWNDETRQAIRERLTDPNLEFAAASWALVEPALDAYAQGWGVGFAATCGAEEASEELRLLRRACFEDARARLEATSRMLADADADVWQHAAELVGGLPSLDRCRQDAALREGSARPPPPELAGAVAEVRATLATAKTALDAGALDRALELSDEAEALSEHLDYGPLRAEVAGVLGDGLLLLSRFGEAEDALAEALRLGLKTRHGDVVHASAVSLAMLVGAELNRPKEAAPYLAFAHGYAKSPLTRSSAWRTEAILDRRLGAAADGEKKLREAMRLLAETLPPDDPRILGLRHDLVINLSAQARYAEAEAEARSVLQARAASLGDGHPAVATSHSGLARVLKARGRLAEAEAEDRKALALRRQVFGPRHISVANTLDHLANTFISQGSQAAAERALNESLEIRRSVLGPDHPALAQSTQALGHFFAGLGDYDQAEQNYERALEQWRRTLGPDHAQVAAALHNLATHHELLGNNLEAESHAARALKINLSVFGPDHPRLASTLTTLGNARRALGKLDAAEEAHDQALSARIATLGEDHPHVSYSWQGLAAVYLDQGRIDEARNYAEKAWAVRKDSTIVAPRRARTALTLAKTLAATDPGRARKLAERARDLLEPYGSAHKRQRTDVDTFLAGLE